jgi:hypothetical protein
MRISYILKTQGLLLWLPFLAYQINPFGLTGIGGLYSTPAFGDLDGDGDLDMLGGLTKDTIFYFENTSCFGLTVYADEDGDSYGDALTVCLLATVLCLEGMFTMAAIATMQMLLSVPAFQNFAVTILMTTAME